MFYIAQKEKNININVRQIFGPLSILVGMVVSEMKANWGIEEIRKLLKKGKPFNEIMTDVMEVGKKIAEKVGYKDYDSPEQFFQEVHEGKSPLFQIDGITLGNVEDLGTNIFAVKVCPLGHLMNEMMKSTEGNDNTVQRVMEGFQFGNGIKHKFLDIGCYITQQIRQMVISSLSVKGKYVFNYIHLGCRRGDRIVLSNHEIEALGIDKSKIEKILEDYECVYAISFEEAERG